MADLAATWLAGSPLQTHVCEDRAALAGLQMEQVVEMLMKRHAESSR